jgi:hypothetical protein
MSKNIDDKAKDYEDSVKRTEIRNTLRMLYRQVEGLSGKDLDLMRKFLDRIVHY